MKQEAPFMCKEVIQPLFSRGTFAYSLCTDHGVRHFSSSRSGTPTRSFYRGGCSFNQRQGEEPGERASRSGPRALV
jgi:hypothetical protein